MNSAWTSRGDLFQISLFWAAKSASWFWSSRNLNALADAEDFILITKRINGWSNGLAKRQAFYATALRALRALA
ncbi:hypothetical protein VD17_19295 [Pseudomonas fluorescens]|uniref:Uncharacterized protein n=1 Tax=Pseudomonas fluorescens TaxID=294 RepID=A0A0F4V6P3_PSEFL|nr:hypothetical protein [Pseudomonas fluorescens]KJZ64175.1 hypothetical protein VD17_19295 [Pseudomonas fluorescens]